MYLFFDTETTGLPKNYQAPLDDFSNWPRIVQLAWGLYDFHGNHWESYNYIIKPEGFIISEESIKIHHISQEKAKKEGIELKKALIHFVQEVSRATYLVAHNIDFDEKIIGSELLRLKMDNNLGAANKICTMKKTVDICRLPNNYGGYKWPNLTELYTYLFKTDFSDVHDAYFDVKACVKCFFELKKRNLL
jgi:DNA polymerase III subunit epsilon